MKTPAEINHANDAFWTPDASETKPHALGSSMKMNRMGVPGFHHGEAVTIVEHQVNKGRIPASFGKKAETIKEHRYRVQGSSGQSGWMNHEDLE